MKIIFLFIVFFSWQCSYGQWFNNMSIFTTQNGLSNNTITCLQKDEAGFLWIATHEGLNRYDGTEFINVLSNPQNNLPSNNVNKIVFINKTLLAVATDAGLCLLNTATLKGRRLELPFISKFSNTGYAIEDLLYKKETKELWVATGHGLFVLGENGILRKKIMATEAEAGKASFARHLLVDRNNEVYFYSKQNSGFYYPDFTNGKIIPAEIKMPGFAINDSLKNGFVLRSAQMLDHETICIISKFSPVGSTDYMYYRNITTGRSFTDKLVVNVSTEKRFSNAFPLNDSLFLVNSYFGEPLIYNSNTHQMQMAADHPLWFTSWPDGFGTSILKDGNNTWIATAKGLLQSSQRTSFFKTNTLLVNRVNANKGLVSYNYAIYDNHKLWLACMGAGLFCLDTINNTLQSVFEKKYIPELRTKMVSTQVVSAGRSVWLYSIYGPAQVDTATLKIRLIDGLDKDAGFDAYGNYPLKDSRGNIWNTIPNGIAQYNIATGKFINHITKYQGGDFPLLRAAAKTEDADGNIWMARQDTLTKFDPVKNVYTVTLLVKNGKPLRPVTMLASDGNDVLYMDVAGAFGMYHISTGSIDLFTKQTGIISTVINNIVSDKEGNAWIATEGGLVFYNKQKMKFSSYTKADGLPDDNVTGANFTDDTKKVLFLGFAKTYCLLEPKDFLLEKAVPENIITTVEVNGELFPVNEAQLFSYDRNSISFSFTGINFNQGQQNNYACILEGFDQSWKYPGTERKINYINLSPAKYIFKVKSANHQGEWNEVPATFSFEIKPPFWQRWWFRVLLIVVAGFGFYYFIKRREAAIQKENTTKLQMSELRMQALRAQMNPHFIFNSLNSIQNYILSNNTIDAASYLSKFAKLMRRILDQSKHNFLPLGEVMETLKMYVEIEAFRFNNEFAYTFNVEEDDDLLDARVPPMLFQPFVENAILHGLMPKPGDKKLSVSCKLVHHSVEIIIEDNGTGRTQQQPKAGHESQAGKLTAGMLESLQQLQNIKATIDIIDKKENDTAAGTMVKIVLPLK
ncbi:MAG: histidine kinase [Ferruginibacter sp.]